ncbi:MAG: hypothetical protein GXX90_02360 [Microbacteriaceae bacterium]|nr:hypothetical protein [Microbacteriaceae bacterium]
MSSAADGRGRAVGAVAFIVISLLLVGGLVAAAWVMLERDSIDAGPPLTVVPAGSGAGAGAAASGDRPAAEPGLASLQNWEWHGPSGTLQATGLVLGVARDDGECRLEATRGDERLTAVAAERRDDGFATICEFELQDPRLAGEEWRLELVYRNDAGESRSEGLMALLN